jgi:hypothetical protein
MAESIRNQITIRYSCPWLDSGDYCLAPNTCKAHGCILEQIGVAEFGYHNKVAVPIAIRESEEDVENDR